LSDEQLFLKEKLRQQRSSIRQSGNGTGTVAFYSLSSVTETVSSFRVANRVGGNGRFLRGFPMRELPCWPHAGEFPTAQGFAGEKATYEDLFDSSMSALAIWRKAKSIPADMGVFQD
jgi:hypothetical protein